uniref:Uncharacterized protein n=1 Tax=Aegilops tauschii subsp. strangulata TaxID=200361 RepID=A0A453Q7N9_AEGTS
KQSSSHQLCRPDGRTGQGIGSEEASEIRLTICMHTRGLVQGTNQNILPSGTDGNIQVCVVQGGRHFFFQKKMKKIYGAFRELNSGPLAP